MNFHPLSHVWTKADKPYAPAQFSLLFNRRCSCSSLFPGGTGGIEPAYRRHRKHEFGPWVRKIPLEEGMATHSRILAWRTPGPEKPGGPQSIGLHRVRQD